MSIDRPDYSIDIAKIYAQIPTADASGAVSVPAGATRTLISVSGAGRNVFMMLYGKHKDMQFRILLDGDTMEFVYGPYLSPSEWITRYSAVNYGVGVRLTKYDEAEEHFCFVITLPYEWKTSLGIVAHNEDVTAARTAFVTIQYLDLRRAV